MRPGEKKYPHIFSPIRINDKLEAKNRIKYASTETNFNDREGFVTDVEVEYMRAQARGGAGIVTTQGAFTDPGMEGKGYVGMMGIHDDKFIPGLKRIADVIREEGSLSCLQLMHCGRVGGVELDYCVGPSDVPQKLPIFRPVKPMSLEKVELTIKEHVDAARRCIEAGYDMIEISGIVGYLISNFISSYTNKRTDRFGGDIRGRCQFMVEIIQGIREVVGPDYPIIMRLCGEELLDDRGGNTPEESLESTKIAQEAGMDILSVTAGWQESAVSVITRDVPMGSWLYIAERMKNNLTVPVSMAYRLFLPEYAEKAIADGKLDFWESCRGMIADPFMPNKIAEDRQEDVIPCMACNICLSRLFRDQPLDCMVRATLGHEGDPKWGYYGFEKAAEPRKVVVVGGGVGGMQAACVAAERGHDVTLYEKGERLGGQLASAANGPYGDDEFMRLVNHLETRCKKAGVKLETGEAIDEGTDVGGDVAIMATGGKYEKPDVPGGDRVISALDVFDGKADVGEKVVILGNLGVGIATALFLQVKGGHDIAMVGKGKKLGRDVNPSYIWRYKLKLKKGGVMVYNQTKVTKIDDDGVHIVDPEGKEHVLPADTVIQSEVKANNDLEKTLEGKFGKVEVVGDALKPRRASNAIWDAYKVAIEI
jgi:2,4-dienoyl-CoA reductase (NADPH2)